MEDPPLLLHSAFRHGVSEAAIIHALRFPVRHIVQDDALVMFIGPDPAGNLIEVGVVEWHGVIAVVHAMAPARSKFLR